MALNRKYFELPQKRHLIVLLAVSLACNVRRRLTRQLLDHIARMEAVPVRSEIARV
jgi:hypothetical protein